MPPARSLWAPAVLCLAALGCDGGLAPVASCSPGFTGICGTVRFRGAVPESTDVVLVVAYQTFPQSSAELFTFYPRAPDSPPTLPYGDSIAAYALPVPPGSYAWVLAVWKKLGTLTPATAESLLAESGFYRNPADTALPGSVVVPAGGARDAVDFTVDFDHRHPVSFWFPPAR